MNKLRLTILFCFFNIISFSQIWEDDLLKTNPNPTIQEKSIAFEEYRAGNLSHSDEVGDDHHRIQIREIARRGVDDGSSVSQLFSGRTSDSLGLSRPL